MWGVDVSKPAGGLQPVSVQLDPTDGVGAIRSAHWGANVSDDLQLSGAVHFAATTTHTQASSAYIVSQQSGQAMSPLTDLPISTANQNLIGPFSSISDVQSVTDAGSYAGSYAGTWEIPVQLPFAFPFFDEQYTSITVSSKGYLYVGSYTADVDIPDKFNTAAPAPDYSNGGAGFPLPRPIISFFHNQDGAVPITDLQNVDGQWYITKFATRAAGAVSSPPPNSVSRVEDGQRFIITTDNTDALGVQAQLAVVLHETGLIEVRYYAIQPSGCNPYMSIVPEGEVSIGVQSAQGGFVSADRFSRRTFADLNGELLDSVVSFTPIQTAAGSNAL